MLATGERLHLEVYSTDDPVFTHTAYELGRVAGMSSFSNLGLDGVRTIYAPPSATDFHYTIKGVAEAGAFSGVIARTGNDDTMRPVGIAWAAQDVLKDPKQRLMQRAMRSGNPSVCIGQVVVAEDMRGQRIGVDMLDTLLCQFDPRGERTSAYVSNDRPEDARWLESLGYTQHNEEWARTPGQTRYTQLASRIRENIIKICGDRYPNIYPHDKVILDAQTKAAEDSAPTS